MKFEVMYGNAVEENLEEDYRTAKKYNDFRIGRKAMYFPAFFKAKYIPLSVIDGAWIKKSVMPIKGCCGGSIPIYVLRICCGSHFFQNIKLENRKDADQALALLKEYRPGLCDSPVVAEEKGVQ